jgi:2Fe-2S ferredoxin
MRLKGRPLWNVQKKNDIYEIEADCGGGCSCATCHVYIEKEWINKIKEPSEMEEDMLDFALNVKDNSRLSCQIKLESDLDGLTVRTPETQF